MSNEKNEHHGPERFKRGKKESEIRYVPINIEPVQSEEDEVDIAEVLRLFWHGFLQLHRDGKLLSGTVLPIFVDTGDCRIHMFDWGLRKNAMTQVENMSQTLSRPQ